MPSSTKNSQSKVYLQRVLSYKNKNSSDINGNYGQLSNQSRLNDELRNRIHQLKSEVDAEKIKSKQAHREKIAEIRRMREDLESEFHLNLEAEILKMSSVKEIEIRKLRESLTRDKEQEIKQIIKYKDEEIRTLRRNMLEEKEQALKELEDKLSRQIWAKTKSLRSTSNDETINKLKFEISDLRKVKDTLENSCKQHLIGLNEKNDIIKNLKGEHERELQRVLREARRENSRSVSELQNLRKSLSDKTAEANKLSLYADRITEEKEQLVKQDRFNVSTERTNLASNSNSPNADRHLSPRPDSDLQRKNAELRRQLDVSAKRIQHLEKEISNLTLSSAAISTENSSLSIASDKRIKELKKRNAELVQIAKKLEEKAKTTKKELDETTRSFNDSKSQSDSSLKKSFAIQRARDLAKHANLVALKDKEIEELKQSFETSTQEEQMMFKAIESSLQVAAKERLRLEHQLMTSPTNGNSDAVEDKVTTLQNDFENVTKKYTEKLEEINLLKEELSNVNVKHDDAILKQSDLEKRCLEIDSAYNKLRMQHDLCCETERLLKEKTNNLERMSDELKSKEQECVALSKSLLNKDQEMNMLQKNMKEKEIECKHLIKTSDMLKSNVKILEDNIRELKKQQKEMDKLRIEYSNLEKDLVEKNDQCESMLININLLENEVEQMKKETKQQYTKIKKLETQNTQFVEQLRMKDSTIEKMKNEMNNLTTTHSDSMSALENRLKEYETKLQTMRNRQPLISKETQTMMDIGWNSFGIQTDDVFLYPKASTAHNSLVDSVFEDTLGFQPKKKISSSSAISETSVNELSIRSDNILEVASERIDQLAVSLSEHSVTEPIADAKQRNASETDDEEEDHFGEVSYEPLKIEELHSTPEITNRPSVSISDFGYADKEFPNEALGASQRNAKNAGEKEKIVTEDDANEHDDISDMGTPREISELFEQYRIYLWNVTGDRSTISFTLDSTFENSKVWRFARKECYPKTLTSKFRHLANYNGDNPIKLFKSKYTYDPMLYSPNEDAHLELALHVGMFIYVYGDMDEDGFYLAELRDGRRGLVPSNLVEYVLDESFDTNEDGSLLNEDLSEAKSLLNRKTSFWKTQKLRDGKFDEPIAAEYLSTTDALKSSQSSLTPKIESLLLEPDFAEDEEDADEEVFVCSPRNIYIERQLSTSVVVAWKAPTDLHEIKGYAIYANGHLKQTVLGSARTKALVSDIHSNQTYRISVHSVKYDGQESKDEQAVLTLGKGTAFAPYNINLSKISSTSANITWKPSYSSHYHVVYVNNKETQKIQPGCYMCQLERLTPDTSYTVNIQARTSLNKEPPLEWANSITFRTLKGYKPEPPMSIQYQVRDNLLHLSWIPVTINEYGTSNGSIVTGYNIYLNGGERGWIKSPTADHAKIPIDKYSFVQGKLHVFLRTQSSSGESENSEELTVQLKELLQQQTGSNLPNKHHAILQNEETIVPEIHQPVSKVNHEIFEEMERQSSYEKSRVLLDVDGGDLWEQDYDDEDDHDHDDKGSDFVDERIEKVEETKIEEERIVVSDDDLSIIEEESEIELLTYEKTRAERTENVDVASGGTLLDVSSDNKVFNSDQSDEKNRTVILSEKYKVAENENETDDISITETIDDDVMSVEIDSNLVDFQDNLMNESLDTESLRLNKLKTKVLKDSYDLLENTSKDNSTNIEEGYNESCVADRMSDTATDKLSDKQAISEPHSDQFSLSQSASNVSLLDSAEHAKPLKDIGKTYSIQKSFSSVDENHNKTFSYNDNNNGVINNEPQVELRREVLISSLKMDSTDLVEMVEKDARRIGFEKDAHKDILDDYPELPLDLDESKGKMGLIGDDFSDQGNSLLSEKTSPAPSHTDKTDLENVKIQNASISEHSSPIEFDIGKIDLNNAETIEPKTIPSQESAPIAFHTNLKATAAVKMLNVSDQSLTNLTEDDGNIGKSNIDIKALNINLDTTSDEDLDTFGDEMKSDEISSNLVDSESIEVIHNNKTASKIISLSELTPTEDLSKLSHISDVPIAKDTKLKLSLTEDISRSSVVLDDAAPPRLKADTPVSATISESMHGKELADPTKQTSYQSDNLADEKFGIIKKQLLSDLSPTENDTSDIDEDSIETGSGLPLSSLQLSSITASHDVNAANQTSHDTDPTNQLSSINFSESDNLEVEQLLNTDIPKIPELPVDDVSDNSQSRSDFRRQHDAESQSEIERLANRKLSLTDNPSNEFLSKSMESQSIELSSCDLPSDNEIKKPPVTIPRRFSVEYSKDSLEASDILSPRSRLKPSPAITEDSLMTTTGNEQPIIDTPDVKPLTNSLRVSDEGSLSRSLRRSLNFDDDEENTNQDISDSISLPIETTVQSRDSPRDYVTNLDSEQFLPSTFSLPQHQPITAPSEDLLFAQSNSETEKSESLVIPKPVKNLSALGGIDISNSEKSDRDVSEISDVFDDDDDDEPEFDVTPIHVLDDTSNESKLTVTESVSHLDHVDVEMNSLKSTNSSQHQNSVNVKAMIGNIEKAASLSPIDQEAVSKEIDKQTKVRIFIALYPYNPLTMSPNIEYADDELAFEEGALIKVYGDVDEDGFFFGELDGVTGMVPGNMVSEIDLRKQNKFKQEDGNNKQDSSQGDSHNKTDSFDVSFMVERKQQIKDSDTTLASSATNLATGSSTTLSKTTANLFSSKSQSHHDVRDDRNEPTLRSKSVSMPDVYLQESATNNRMDPYQFNPKRMIALFDYDPNVSSPNVDAEIELAFRRGEAVHVYGEMDEDGFYAGSVNGVKGLVPSNFVREAPDTGTKVKGSTDSPKVKKKSSFLKKGKKIFSKLKGGK